jgi:cell filamentation protein
MNLKNSNRYCVPSDEDFEPDSNNTVLKNYLGIKTEAEIGIAEEQELKRTALDLLSIFDNQHQFTAEDICNIHELWLGNIYPSAGKYRTVSMSKERFLFAAPAYIEKSMIIFEKNYLAKYTPCHDTNINELASTLGIIHTELIVIHPFREGNGRTARLLADLMVMQANKPPLNFTNIDQTKNKEGFTQYISAIQAGAGRNYGLITEIFRALLEQSTI